MFKIKSILIGMLLAIFYFDSGGPFGLRIYALIIFTVLYFFYMINQIKGNVFFSLFSKSYLAFNVTFFLFIMYGFSSAVINGLFDSSFIWLSPLLFYFVFQGVLIYFDKNAIISGYVLSGVIFSLIILTVFFIALILPTDAANLFLLKLQFIPGWFYLKQNGLIIGFPNIYFQATLGLVPVGIIAYIFDYKKSFYLILIALSCSLSRFGVFVMLAFVASDYFFSKFKIAVHNRAANTALFSFFLGLCVFSSFLIFYFLQDGSYTHSYESMNVRRGHVLSIFNNITLSGFIFGAGPGSIFYSLGFGNFVSNIEISQLEVFRKYGFLGYSILHYALYLFIRFLIINKSLDLVYVFLAFYIVSLSNPILLTFNLSLLLALLSSVALKRNEVK